MPQLFSPALASMTGFARVDGAAGAWRWTWEARSVNGKGFDLRLRLASGFEELEAGLRQAAGERFTRGNVNLALQVQEVEGARAYQLNEQLVDELLALARRIEEQGAPPQRLDSLLSVRGVLEPVEAAASEERETALAAMAADAERALDALAEARRAEGARLGAIVSELISEIERLTEQAGGLAATQPRALRERLSAQLALLLESSVDLPEERLAHEAALLATRADIREELDRLAAHTAQARTLMESGGPVGRRLDFLAQEFNREANTLCSKSIDIELTRIGLDLKTAIDRLREQVQNLE